MRIFTRKITFYDQKSANIEIRYDENFHVDTLKIETYTNKFGNCFNISKMSFIHLQYPDYKNNHVALVALANIAHQEKKSKEAEKYAKLILEKYSASEILVKFACLITDCTAIIPNEYQANPEPQKNTHENEFKNSEKNPSEETKQTRVKNLFEVNSQKSQSTFALDDIKKLEIENAISYLENLQNLI